LEALQVGDLDVSSAVADEACLLEGMGDRGNNFGSYNTTYGSLGAVIGFLTWIWLSSIVVLVGAELDAAQRWSIRPRVIQSRWEHTARGLRTR
jgi:hypothetical protein